ncbi:hypothetical protein PoB_001638900 [Plakobranchus ocellatus]|uniref:Uncharacterized protein n=1 Tax=Plakobranchus ocellatus TaxID=259542 RepID=A0AAV3Z678_9GAST|nr:hypothetical protein PoB_001638900 [Plakobranchus ocellatus]
MIKGDLRSYLRSAMVIPGHLDEPALVEVKSVRSLEKKNPVERGDGTGKGGKEERWIHAGSTQGQNCLSLPDTGHKRQQVTSAGYCGEERLAPLKGKDPKHSTLGEWSAARLSENKAV